MAASGRSQLFFSEHIEPTVRDWEASPLERHRAMALAVNLNQMADYFFHEFGADSSKVLGARDSARFRDELSKVFPAFALVRDVADTHKHFEIGRANRTISNASQATLGALSIYDVPWDEGKWDSPPEIVVTFNDGSKHAFDTAVRRVREMWVEKLASAGAA